MRPGSAGSICRRSAIGFCASTLTVPGALSTGRRPGVSPRPPPVQESGRTPLLQEKQRAALVAAVEVGPEPYLDGVVRWRLVDLAQWLWDEFGVSVSRQTLGRELRTMGFRKLSARPQHHAQDAQAIETFKKTSPPSWRISAPSMPRVRT